MFRTKKLIIVTGGAGFVGSNLIRLLIDKTKFKINTENSWKLANNQLHKGHSREEEIDNLIRITNKTYYINNK